MHTLYVVRHGQTEWNAASRMQGRLDSALTALGQRQASAHGATLKLLGGADVLLVSPLGRTRETANLVNSHLNAPMEFDEALMERDCGIWSGLTVDEIEERWPNAWRERDADPYHHRPPEGENHDDMLARSADLLASLRGRPEPVIALITHGVMSRCVLTYFLELAPDQAALVRHPNNIFYRLQFSEDGIEPAYFTAAGEDQAGLLTHVDGETIRRSSGGTDQGAAT